MKKKKNIKKEDLTKILAKYYSQKTLKHILAGEFLPRYEKMLLMLDNDCIPLEAWRDIREFYNIPKRKWTRKADSI